MMTPNDYLLYSIRHTNYRRKAWLISLLSLTQETDAQKAEIYPGKLIREPFGWFTVDDKGEKIKIETKQATTTPLFSVKTPLTITPEWAVSVQSGTVDTFLGTLLVNLICLVDAFGDRFPYRTGRFSPRDLEHDIMKKLETTPLPGGKRDPAFYYVDEYLKFCEGIGFLEMLTQVVAHSITQIGMMPAPGRKEFKKSILPKYEGKLTDPIEMAKFEKELEGFDDAYLKDDPAYGKFMSGKKVKGSRMKLFMTQGGESNGFDSSLAVTPIVQALEDGIPTDPGGFTAISNTIRYGSFARGAETINGGVTAKGLMRAADNWRITEGDCKTPLGLHRLYRGKETKNLTGRYVIVQGKAVLIETDEQAATYDAQGITVRSPQYCRRPGTQTCEVCAGKALSKFPTGTPIPLMEVSGGILNDSLKLMHNTALSTATMSLASVIT